ncbi:MAG: ABC transporter permease subunit, partial [Verrucomicrobiales bacterium]|nr:ABC transporter permease subunit [Verrucomicrobiales bacterium]
MVTLLPVVRREMRVAARRRTTFLVRFVGAVSAVLLGGAFLLPAAIPGVAGASGRLLLQILGTLALILTLVAGPLLTADCISRERREGTLGFLFLTDLNGLDVVAGKFAALALVPIHGLLAALPVAALTLCLGGVTAAEFWAVQLVLFNTLFLSLAIGIWVSSLVSDDRQALGTALALVAAVTLVPGVAGATIQALLPHSEWTLVRIAGPAGILETAFDSGTRTGSSYFLFGLLFQHGLAWCFLATSALIV